MTGADPALKYVSNASLWPPRLVSDQSAWNEHIPFAGWIVEAAQPQILVELGTHTGVSYFAFCESVLRLELGTRCFAVDTWHGDEQSGHYGEEVYRAVRELNTRYYESFSRLLRTTFDEAVDEFEDSSIDLLHLDGLHSYEAVRNDFETWLPKMSPQGLVLIHDVNERRTGFGAQRFLNELTTEYNTFEFTHGHGLGVIALGPNQPEAVVELMNLEPPDVRLLRSVYEALGRRISGEFSASMRAEGLDERDRQLRDAGEALDRERENKRRLTDDAAVRSVEIETSLRENRNLRDELLAKSEEFAHQESDLASSRQDLRLVRGTLKNRTDRLKAQGKETKRQAKRVAAIESSTSWRLTAPVRFVADRAKALSRLGQRRRSRSASPAESMYELFDQHDDAATRRRLAAGYRSRPHLRETLVSVIMPTHNRAEQVGDAMDSVVAQTHDNWELIVVDDGSEDDTPAVVGRYTDDARVHYEPIPWGGVSRARNTGLDLASGSVIAFLDSDNRWDPDFLELMLVALDGEGVDIAYSGLRLVEDGEVIGYRGRDFDYSECLEGNFVDLNVLCHRRSITDSGARFDETLRRLVDWDYLLSIAQHREVAYEPFLGADYTHHSSEDQISEKEPRIYRKVVEVKHDTQSGAGPSLDSRAAFERIPLTFAIRIAAPREVRDQWGDYHYATGLAQALERKGHAVGIKYHEEEFSGVPDVVISLRGLTEHEPLTGAVNVVWSISHPDLLSWNEIDGYDLFFAASLTWREATRWSGSRPAHTLLQATDRARFFPSPRDGAHSGEVLFVGNSRKAHRAMVSDAVEAGLPLAVYGRDWEGRIPPKYIKGEYLPNDELADWYGSAGAVLNDHWDSMREYGYVSNRLFDVVAAGGKALSDHVPSVARLFGDAVATVTDSEDLADRFAALDADERDRNEIAVWALRHHSFDDRAQRLLAHIEEFVLRSGGYTTPGVGNPPCPLCEVVTPAADEAADIEPAIHLRGAIRQLRVGVIPQPAGKAVTSSAFIRLVQPLTSEIDDLAVSLTRVGPDDPDASPIDALADLDAIVVSRTAFDSVGTAQAWFDAAAERGIPIALDTDDAFHLMDDAHPEFNVYREKLEAYALALDRAAEVWCSTPALAKSLAGEVSNQIVIPNSIDPRLWRQYRRPWEIPVRDGPPGLQILYAGTATHGADFVELVSVFDELAAKVRFGLTVVGVADDLPERQWLRRLRPGRDTLYPRYARWLRGLGPLFDVGIAPLADTEFNQLKSDIKLLEYLAIGVVPLLSDLDPYSESDVAVSSMLHSGPDEWSSELERLGTDGRALFAAKDVAYSQREVMWGTRSAAQTGAMMANRLADLVDRTG